MKVWLFYLIDKKLVKRYREYCLVDGCGYRHQAESGNWLLYSYTDKKRIAKLFKKTRNMECFYTKEVDLSDKEFEEMEGLFHGYVNLILSSLNDLYEESNIKIPVTATEQWICVDNKQETMFNYINANIMFDWRILSEDLRESLWKIGFMFYDTSAERTEALEAMEERYGDPPYIRVHEPFNLFLFLYKDILNKKGLLEVIENGEKS